MDEIKTLALTNGVEGCYINSKKFKTSRISINFVLPAEKGLVSAHALLSNLLTRASEEYPDYSSLNAKLNELYGATLFGDVIKLGDMQIIKFVIAVLDDKYTLDGESVTSEATELLLSMLFNPPLENGLFKDDDFQSEKRLLIESIKGEINDKRKYAIIKTEGEVYKNEPSGISRYGSLEDAQNLKNEDVVKAWKNLFKNAFVRVNVISSSKPNTVFEKITKYFAKFDRNVVKQNLTTPHEKSQNVNEIEERMDVTQGKLCMAFSVKINGDGQSKVNARIMADLYGGGPYSKLFTNVREKLSLCYYCAARLNTHKGVLMVDSGILDENKEKAFESIIEQLKQIQDGNFTDSDIEASKMSIIDSAKTISDSPVSIDSWYSMRVFEDDYKNVDEFISLVTNVTKQDVINIAKAVSLDTVYYLGTNRSEDQ